MLGDLTAFFRRVIIKPMSTIRELEDNKFLPHIVSDKSTSFAEALIWFLTAIVVGYIAWFVTIPSDIWSTSVTWDAWFNSSFVGMYGILLEIATYFHFVGQSTVEGFGVSVLIFMAQILISFQLAVSGPWLHKEPELGTLMFLARVFSGNVSLKEINTGKISWLLNLLVLMFFDTITDVWYKTGPEATLMAQAGSFMVLLFVNTVLSEGMATLSFVAAFRALSMMANVRKQEELLKGKGKVNTAQNHTPSHSKQQKPANKAKGNSGGSNVLQNLLGKQKPNGQRPNNGHINGVMNNPSVQRPYLGLDDDPEPRRPM